ncbi:hypothetical protein V2I52_17015 [Brenneria sp. g21c3]|nr:hypothetical protein [Brenneria sp. g21c3]
MNDDPGGLRRNRGIGWRPLVAKAIQNACDAEKSGSHPGDAEGIT